MRFLAAYVLKGRMQAVLVAAVMAVLAIGLLLLPVSFLSGGTVALVTLRYGLQAGLQLSLMASIVAAALLALLQQPWQYSGLFLLMLWLPVWIMALSLRRTASPARSIMLAVAFGVMVLLGFTWAVDNPAQWGLDLQRHIFEPMLQQLPETELKQAETLMVEKAELMRGMVVLLLVISLISSLLLGRWWQALLLNPGGFATEFRQLRLGKNTALAVVLIVVVYMLWSVDEGTGLLLQDVVALLQVPFILQGLAVTHMLAHTHGVNKVWLVAMYLLLLLGPMALPVLLLGVVDNWFDFRSKFGRGKQADIE